MPSHSSLYLGIDIGKAGHVAALLSPSLLHRYGRFEACPTLAIKQSRADFEKLLAAIKQYGSSGCCHVLLERTGHYGFALEQFLIEHGVQLYRMHARKRYGKNKTDKHDAQALAVILYNQVELGIHVIDKSQRVYPLIPPSPIAQFLRGLIQHRSELLQECTQRKNKLTSIMDEVFPEFTQIYIDPNSPSALALRTAFPGPESIANASLDELCRARVRTHPGNKQLAQLQDLATSTIGTKNEHRLRSLVLEQSQLIAELQILQQHVLQIDQELQVSVLSSREGQILTSFIGIGPVQAATLLAHIGSIANFESASKLRGYVGWSPRRSQTGTSFDNVTLTRGGNAALKQTMFLIVLSAIRADTKWKALYDRLVPTKCHYDPRLKRYRGRMKVIGRVAGQLIEVMFTLLKRDFDVLASLPQGVEPPPPVLYDPQYQPIIIHRVPASV